MCLESPTSSWITRNEIMALKSTATLVLQSRLESRVYGQCQKYTQQTRYKGKKGKEGPTVSRHCLDTRLPSVGFRSWSRFLAVSLHMTWVINQGCYQCCCLVNRGTIGVNSLPKAVIRQRRDCDLNPGPSAPESSTLTTRLPSHPGIKTPCKYPAYVLTYLLSSKIDR